MKSCGYMLPWQLVVERRIMLYKEDRVEAENEVLRKKCCSGTLSFKHLVTEN
jgi:hypothetical protein